MNDLLNNLPVNVMREMSKAGHPVTLSSDANGELYLDFNTGMKSHLHVYWNNGYVAKMRYENEKMVETPSDLWFCLMDCACGFDFMTLSVKKFYENGFETKVL